MNVIEHMQEQQQRMLVEPLCRWIEFLQSQTEQQEKAIKVLVQIIHESEQAGDKATVRRLLLVANSLNEANAERLSLCRVLIKIARRVSAG